MLIKANTHMNMSKTLYLIAVLVLLFFGSSVRAAFGLMDDTNLFLINGTFFVLLACFIVHCCSKGFNKLNREAYYFAFFGILMLIGKFITHVGGYLSVINYVFVPCLFCLLYPKGDIRFRQRIYKLLFYFFFIESIWAILERVFLINVFPPVSRIEEMGKSVIGVYGYREGFRSSALLGSPLTNALCLTCILLFILFSNLKQSTKTLCFVIGYLAILCFNTRTSIILWPILFIISFIYNNRKKGKIKSIVKGLLIFSVIAVLFAYIIIANGLADRLIGRDIMDNSANVRVDTWTMFMAIDHLAVFFSLGVNSDEIITWMELGGVEIIENSFVLYFLELGGIGLLMVIWGYYKILSIEMKGYSKFARCFIFGSFILLGLTNNGLKETAMSLFIICCLVMPKGQLAITKA